MSSKRYLPTFGLLSALLVLVSAPAIASTKTAMRVHFGANVSSESTNYKSPEDFSGSIDDSVGFSVTAAFPFQPWGAAEVGYVSLGDADFDGLFQGTPDTGTIEATGFRFGLIGALPISKRFALLGRVGGFAWEVEESEVFGGVPEPPFSDSGTDAYFGAGAQFGVSKRIDLRAEWIRYLGVGEVSGQTGDGDTDSVSLGVTVRLSKIPYFGRKRKDIQP